MKILSILPVNVEVAVAAHVVDQKRTDKQILASLPSRVCHSFDVARLLLREYPLDYDVVVSTYSPKEMLPPRDQVPMTKGSYGAVTHHITQILKENPLVSLVLWTYALAGEIDYPLGGLEDRIFCIFRGSAYFPGQLRCVENAERDLLREYITDALTELCLTLNERGEIALEAICRRGPIEMSLQEPGPVLPVRPCLRKVVQSEEKQTEEFLQLLNKSGVTTQEVESFLEAHPCFPLGNEMRTLRWTVGLRRDSRDQGEQSMSILLEPVWVADQWKINSLKSPAVIHSSSDGSDRAAFSHNLVTALAQLRARQAAISRPRIKQQLTEAGLAGFTPRLSLVLGDKETPELPQHPPDGFGTAKPITYAELTEQVRAEMEWLQGPTDMLDSKIRAKVREQKIRKEMEAMMEAWWNEK